MATASTSDTIVIGAGFSGLCALIRLRREFPGMSVEVYEQSGDIGGTWSKNTYPGLNCDIPSLVYSFSFATDYEWQSTYGTQKEILSYMHHAASSEECWPYIHLKQRCVSARWLPDEFLWRVDFVDLETGKTYAKHCRFLITGAGFCDAPKGPEDIMGIEGFKGAVFHSAEWDHTFDFRDKNVVVLGNGSSANQFVPWLVEHGKIRSLVQVVRSAHWIAPKQNALTSRSKKWVLCNIPFARTAWRFCLGAKLDLAFHAFKKTFFGTQLRRLVQQSLARYMRRSAPEKYHDILIPDFDFGAKRPVLDHGYLSALHDPRVTLLKSREVSISGSTEVTVGCDETFQADVIILGTGFKTQELLTPMTIRGIRDELPAFWKMDGNYPSAYMGVCVSGFPNLFILTGPNTLPSGHSTLAGIESSVEYIIRLLRHLDPTSGSRVSINVKPDAQADYNEMIQRRLRGLVYTADVPNWCIDASTGRNTLIYPGSRFEFWRSRCVSRVRWNDFEVTARR